MKKNPVPDTYDADIDGMPAEFEVQRGNLAPNRFADRFDDKVTVVTLDRETSEVFHTSEEVNEALRSLIHKSRHARRPRESTTSG